MAIQDLNIVTGDMTYEECITLYGTENTNYCSSFGSSQDVFGQVGDLIGSFLANPLLWVLGAVLLVLVLMSFKVIHQQKVGVVERFGRYNRSLQAGLRMIIPFVEKIADRVDLEQFLLKVNPLVKTKDDQIVDLSVAVMYKVIPEMASESIYQVNDPEEAISALVTNEVKATVSTMTLQEIFDARQQIEDAVNSELTDTVSAWGYEITKVVIDDPSLSEEMRQAYNSVGVAKQSQIAATAEGEALRIELVAQAEAEGQSLVIKGKAYATMRDEIANGNAAAIKKMTEGTGLTDAQAMHLLVQIDSNDAVRDAAQAGSTVVVTTAHGDQATLGMIAAQ